MCEYISWEISCTEGSCERVREGCEVRGWRFHFPVASTPASTFLELWTTSGRERPSFSRVFPRRGTVSLDRNLFRYVDFVCLVCFAFSFAPRIRRKSIRKFSEKRG